MVGFFYWDLFAPGKPPPMNKRWGVCSSSPPGRRGFLLFIITSRKLYPLHKHAPSGIRFIESKALDNIMAEL